MRASLHRPGDLVNRVKNAEPNRSIVVRDRQRLEVFAATDPFARWMARAPAVIVIVQTARLPPVICSRPGPACVSGGAHHAVCRGRGGAPSWAISWSEDLEPWRPFTSSSWICRRRGAPVGGARVPPRTPWEPSAPQLIIEGYPPG